MQRLKTNLRINGLQATLIRRTASIALVVYYNGRRYEVTRIYVRPKFYDPFWFYHSPEQEGLSNNSEFREDGSKQFNQLKDAEAYFRKLTDSLNETPE